MKNKIAYMFCIGLSFLNTTATIAQTTPMPKKIEISGGFSKTYKIDEVKIKNLKELESILYVVCDNQVNESVSKAKTWNTSCQVFGSVGGFLIGYPLGGALAGKELNKPLLFTGIGITSIAILFAVNAEKHALAAVERYNYVVEENYKVGFWGDPFKTSCYITLRW